MRRLAFLFSFAWATCCAQVILSPLPCAEQSTLLSLNGNTPTTIQFVNTSSETVTVYWLNYSGQLVLYNTLPPGQSYTQGTFLTHPWVITNQSNSCITIYEAAATAGIARIVVNGIVLTQTGFTFQAVQGGPSPAASTFKVVNGAAGAIPLSASVSTVSGGNWLTVSPASGTADSTKTPPAFKVMANPNGLTPGDYYGQIRIDSSMAANTPQFLSIVLNVSSAGTEIAPSVAPTGLNFVAPSAQASPPPQTIQLTALANHPSPFGVSVTTSSGQWLSVTPASGTLNPGQPVTLEVSAATGSLAPGSYAGSIAIDFSQDAVIETVNVIFVVPSAPISSTIATIAPRAAAVCTPSKLLPTFTVLGSNFVAPAAWPAPIEVFVTDDCGSPMLSGSVVVTFSNGDPPLTLASELNGGWSGTWAPGNARAGTTVTATAIQPSTSLMATVSLGGNVATNAGVPQLNPGGIVSSASYAANAAPSPGEIVAVFGQNMADNTASSSSLPLSTDLANASLLMAGRLIPLVFTSSGQINAIMPYEVPTGAIYQMVLQRGTKLSLPQTVTVAPAEPAIFTTNATGQGQGHIYVVPSATQQILADASNPATAGDVIVIYGAGLGPVSPAIGDGVAPPLATLENTVNTVTLTIGGVAADVLFAGLTPGFPGLYQVNATIPSGITPGSQVPVVLTEASLSSVPVTMAIR